MPFKDRTARLAYQRAYQKKRRADIGYANYKKTPEQRRAEHYKQRYGLSVEQVEAKAAAQGYKCAICGKEFTMDKANLDHCHKTLKIRDILCGKCNRMLGLAGDSIEVLMSSIEYLKKHSQQ